MIHGHEPFRHLDDITTVLDDVALFAKVAAKKTTGVLDALAGVVAGALVLAVVSVSASVVRRAGRR